MRNLHAVYVLAVVFAATACSPGNRESLLVSLSQSILHDVQAPVPAPAAPAPAPGPISACNRGPTIQRISDVFSQSLIALFDGDGIAELGWKITQNGASVRNGVFVPADNHPSIRFATLQTGNYILQLFGTKCIGTSSMAFSITGDKPPEPVDLEIPPVVASGDTGVMAKTDDRYIDIRFKAAPNGKDFLISDVAPYKAPNGYEFWWAINTMSPVKGQELKNYLWIGGGIISVIKHTYKIGLDSEGRWNNAGGWYDPNAGVQANIGSPKPVVGGQSVVVLSRDYTIPSWKPINHAPQWSKLAPEMQLPDGKFMNFHARPIWDRNQRTPTGRRKRGENFNTNWGEYPDLADKDVADHTIGLRILGVTGPKASNDEFNGDLSILEKAGENWVPRGMSFLETAEGNIWMSPTGPSMQALLRGRKKAYERAGIWDRSCVSDAYGSLAFHGISAIKAIRWENTLPKMKALYSKNKDQVRNEFALFRSNGDLINTTNVKWYGHTPELMEAPLDQIFQMEVSKLAGYKTVGYPGNLVEILDHAGYGGGFNWQNGEVITTHLARPGWVESFNMGILYMWFGDGFYLWDAGDVGGDDKSHPALWSNEDGFGSYVRSGAAPTRSPTGEDYPAVSMHMYDAMYSGVQYYMQFKESEGQSRKYVSHTFGGINVKAEPDGSDVLSAITGRHGICQVRGNTLLYFNPFNGNETKTLKVEGFGEKQITGNKVYLFKK